MSCHLQTEYFGVPNNEEESDADHWISHFAENVSTTSLSIFVDRTAVWVERTKISWRRP